jgi:WD40 repeat protein
LWFWGNGKFIAQAYSPVILLWETATGRPIPPLVGHRGAVTKSAVSLESHSFVTASGFDQTMVVWDTERVERRQAFALLLDTECWDFLWNCLATEEFCQGSICLLAAYPQQTVGKIKDKLETINATSTDLQNLIRKLGDQDIDIRDKAQRMIEDLGATALPFIKSIFDKQGDAEVRVRLHRILDRSEMAVKAEERRLVNLQTLVKELSQTAPFYSWVDDAQNLLKSPVFRFVTVPAK